MYKYCIVPKCTNTSVKTPDKLFFNVPKDPKLRKKWCRVVKRYNKTPLSAKATRHCCEDHFDLETDMENYVKYKLVGGKLKLKTGVMPHKLDCQKPPKKIVPRLGFLKRQRIEFMKNVMSKEINHEDLTVHPVEVIECPDIPIAREEKNPLDIPEENDNIKPKPKSRGIQVNIRTKMCDKSTNTPKKWKSK